MIGTQVVMDVVATGCPSDDPAVRANVAACLLEETWHALRLPVDQVQVRVRGNAAEYVAVASRAELSRRFGPGPRGAVWPVREQGPSDWIWLLLPVGCIAYGAGMFWFVRYLARRGVFVVFLRWR